MLCEVLRRTPYRDTEWREAHQKLRLNSNRAGNTSRVRSTTPIYCHATFGVAVALDYGVALAFAYRLPLQVRSQRRQRWQA
jgi:hypothetical protein